MKVLWISHFSNPQVREKLNLSVSRFELIIRRLLGKRIKQSCDYAVWITNGIKEFEEIDEVEMHVLSPHHGMSKRIESFTLNGINYHFFKPDDYSFLRRAKFILNKNIKSKHRGNRKIIKKIVNNINPDIIHMFGAENPQYSIAALDIDTNKYPLFVSLQTLMNEPDFKRNYYINNKQYVFRSGIERKILQRVIYIGSTVQKYREIVWKSINPSAIFFKTYLAVQEKIEIGDCEKKFDFVFFAASIKKEADYAVEAFAIACIMLPNLTLNIIGGTPEPFTNKLLLRIKELGIEDNVHFRGKLQTHKEVLYEINLSRFALLPLKVDGVSGTIREAMFSGIPVVTTKTRATPNLNRLRESILISEIGDYQAMADNMIKLKTNMKFAEKLAKNGLITANELWNNRSTIAELINSYKAIIDHHDIKTPIPNQLGTINPNIEDE